jgi:hypothetical protein
MKIELKNIILTLVLFIGSGLYFFFKSANNTNGLIINHLFYLNTAQAKTFYFVMGCLCIGILLLCGVAVHLQKKREKSGL